MMRGKQGWDNEDEDRTTMRGGDSDEGTHHQMTPTRGWGRDRRGEGDDNGESTATTTAGAW